MMKNKYICISLLCLLLSACLSENPIGKMPEDKAYTSAKDNLAKAESSFEGEEWEQANAYAKASLAALDGIREVTPLPEFYIVKPWAETKDCYWNISGRPYVYNNPLLWENLYQANKSNMPKPEDPNLIHPGMKMKIPSLTGEYRSGTYDPKKSYETYGK